MVHSRKGCVEMRCAVIASVAVWIGLSATPVLGIPNNGFETDYVYVCRDPLQGGQLRMYNEADGTRIGDLLPDGTNWESLTFAGTGSDDARLFVARNTGTDIEIAEVDSAGQTVKSANLSTILGAAVGPALDFGARDEGSPEKQTRQEEHSERGHPPIWHMVRMNPLPLPDGARSWDGGLGRIASRKISTRSSPRVPARKGLFTSTPTRSLRRQVLTHPSAVRRIRLQELQKCWLKGLMKPMLPSAPGMR